MRSFRPRKKRAPGARRPDTGALIREQKRQALARERGYREQSLRLHGWICGRCGREFDESDVHQLTVHHRDGNHHNNPSDGSNWENLCRDCHDAEHSRELLGRYLKPD